MPPTLNPALVREPCIVFLGMQTLGAPTIMDGDYTTSLRGRGTEPGTTEEATVDWSGKARPQHQTSVRWSDDTDFSYSQELMVQPCDGGHTTHRGLLQAERVPA